MPLGGLGTGGGAQRWIRVLHTCICMSMAWELNPTVHKRAGVWVMCTVVAELDNDGNSQLSGAFHLTCTTDPVLTAVATLKHPLDIHVYV